MSTDCLSPATSGEQPPPASDQEQVHATKISRALSAYERIGDVSAFVANFGRAIAQSKMFGCSNVEQGQVLAMACVCERSNPLAILRKYHLLGGRLTMRADAMLADFKAIGGDYVIVSRTPDKAAIEMKPSGRGKKPVMFEFTWQEAQIEDYVFTSDANQGRVTKRLPDGTVNPKALKDNWSTPRRRMQMLWARVVSDAVRAVAPEVNAGSYTPEELGGGVEDDDRVIDVPSVPAPPPPAAAAEVPITRLVDQQHIETIRQLVGRCGLNNQAMADYCQQEFGRTCRIEDLTAAEASSIIGYLTRRLDAAAQQAPPATNGQPPAAATSPPAPAAAAPQPERRHKLLRELKQLKAELLTHAQYETVLDKNYNVKSAMSLNVEQLEKFVAGLRRRKEKRAAVSELSQWAEGALQKQPSTEGN